MKRWICLVCGYVHRGEPPPAACPICGVGPEEFDRLPDEEIKEAAENAPGRIVIIGDGAAGHNAALAARRYAPKASITVLTEEAHPFYSRLSLTPYIAGEVPREKVLLASVLSYAEQEIDLKCGVRVVELDRDGSSVVTTDGQRLGYDRLIVCTGATPGRPPIPGVDDPRVLVLRTLDDADRLVAMAPKLKGVVVLGGGLLGLETAYALRTRAECAVTVLEMAERLLPRQLDRDAAALLEAAVREKGLRVELGVRVSGIAARGEDGPMDVRLSEGRVVSGDIVVVAAGIRASVALAKAAGIEVNHGVVVDDGMRSSDPHIYAAGDVAEHRGTLYGIWPTALAMGDVAGANAAGAELTLDRLVSATFLKVLGVPVYSAGRAAEPPEGSREIAWHEEDRGVYRKIVVHEGQVVGGILLGDLDGSVALSNAVEGRLEVTLPSEGSPTEERRLLCEVLEGA